MDETVYICGLYAFPKGSAGSVYVQNLAQAFLAIGYRVVLVSDVNHKSSTGDYLFLTNHRDRVVLEEIALPQVKWRHYFAFNFELSRYYSRALSRYTIRKSDLLVSYSMFSGINEAVLKAAKQSGARCMACVVEWLTKNEFKFGWFDWRFWRYLHNFHRIFPGFDGIFSISTLLDGHFRDRGCRSMVLPIMSDPYEYPYRPARRREKRRFVYPANGLLKDALGVVLAAFALLDDTALSRVELDLSGVSEVDLIKMIGEQTYHRLKEHIRLHSWMAYEELVALYQTVDFLVISRATTRMTEANFPSKVPEAMNYGVVPVVSRVGDYTNLYLDDKNSVVFALNTVECCREALVKCLAIAPEALGRLSDGARQTSIDKFFYSNWTEKIAAFICSLSDE